MSLSNPGAPPDFIVSLYTDYRNALSKLNKGSQSGILFDAGAVSIQTFETGFYLSAFFFIVLVYAIWKGRK